MRPMICTPSAFCGCKQSPGVHRRPIVGWGFADNNKVFGVIDHILTLARCAEIPPAHLKGMRQVFQDLVLKKMDDNTMISIFKTCKRYKSIRFIFAPRQWHLLGPLGPRRPQGPFQGLTQPETQRTISRNNEKRRFLTQSCWTGFLLFDAKQGHEVKRVDWFNCLRKCFKVLLNNFTHLTRKAWDLWKGLARPLHSQKTVSSALGPANCLYPSMLRIRPSGEKKSGSCWEILESSLDNDSGDP